METQELTGRRLDLAVACALFSWKSRPHSKDPEIVFITPPEGEERAFTWTDIEQRRISPLPAYSTDMAAAWLVVEALNGPHCRSWLAEMLQATDQSGEYGGQVVWQVELRHTPTGKHVFGIAPSLPEAICRAALKAADWV